VLGDLHGIAGDGGIVVCIHAGGEKRIESHAVPG
jgi:hypothetical protein